MESVGIGGLDRLDTLARAAMHAGQKGGAVEKIPQRSSTLFFLLFFMYVSVIFF